MSEDKQKQQVLEVVPQYPNLIARFDGEPDNESTFPDLDFVVPGLDKPLKLSRNTLAPVSQLVRGVLSCDRSKTQFEWPFDTKNKKDRDALVKVLRFCYGETMKVVPHEVCPVVAAVCRLQLKGAQEVVKKLEDFAVKVAQEDVGAGAAMLSECAARKARQSQAKI